MMKVVLLPMMAFFSLFKSVQICGFYCNMFWGHPFSVHIVYSHYVWLQDNLSSTSSASVPQFVGVSCICDFVTVFT